jgi:hypothetical protein
MLFLRDEILYKNDISLVLSKFYLKIYYFIILKHFDFY